MKVKIKSIKKCLELDPSLHCIPVDNFKDRLEGVVFEVDETRNSGVCYHLAGFYVPLLFCDIISGYELKEEIFAEFMIISGELK